MDVDPLNTDNNEPSSSRHHHNRSYRRHARRNHRRPSEGNNHAAENPRQDPRPQEEASPPADESSRHRRHHRRHRHHHGSGKILVKYLRTVARNSLHNLYDELTHAIPPEMSVHYQNIHEYLQEVQQQARGHAGQPGTPNPLHFNMAGTNSTPANGQLNEMHEFVSASSPSAAYAPPPPYNPYAPPPPRSGIFPLGDFLQDPLNAGLSTLTKVAQIARSPTQIINTAASGASAAYQLIQNTNHIFTRPPGHAERIYPNLNGVQNGVQDPFGSTDDGIPLPPPVLPLINCTVAQNRLEPLTAEDLIGKQWTRDELCIRVFKGGIAEDNQLRTRLWPIILGLAEDLPDSDTRAAQYEFDWANRENFYHHYRKQWDSILPDQERRFTAFRERKSLIERDVIRCDRSHPYYQGESGSLDSLRDLLLTYMMYDFDTGYVQGMSDLASPLLFVADGQVDKAFWFFTQVMEFTHNNFEMSQLTIKLQLDMLWKLIELTDPIFAQYLANNESDNCYFAFRWIVCQFKREFMKNNADGYADVLLLWESIWTCGAMRRHLTKLREEQAEKQEKEKENKTEEPDVARNPPVTCPSPESTNSMSVPSFSPESFKSFSLRELEERESAELSLAMAESLKLVDTVESPSPVILDSSKLSHSESSSTVASEEGGATRTDSSSRPSVTAQSVNLNVYIPEVKRLSDSELYVLCICLCIIRRERDWIMANRYDATEILKHFNTLQLNANLRDILIHAANIWSWLVYDEKEELLYSSAHSSSPSVSSLINQAGTASNASTAAHQGSTAGSYTATGARNEVDDFDLLPDAKMPALSGEDYFLLNS